MLKPRLLLWFLLFSTFCGYCQNKFEIEKGKRSAKIRFQLVNNLVIIPVELNGVPLSFLLDTGVNTTVLLNLESADSLKLPNSKKIELRGLGGDEIISAYRSDGNQLRIGKTFCRDLIVYTVFEEKVNFSPRLGVPVHGIIGHDFFKDFVVEINYSHKYMRVHDPARFSKNLRRYSAVELQFFQRKPYIQSSINVDGKKIETTFLLDNGLGDALWVFNDNTSIKIPEKSFEDLLGLGLLGDVRGQRTRINSLSIGDYELKEVTAAFPDSTSVQGLRTFEERSGSIGGEVLKRFNIFLDYGNQKMYVRKNRNFDLPFNYDMSGILLEHDGFIIVETLVKVLEPTSAFGEDRNLMKPYPELRRGFELQPSFRIMSLRENSPAKRAGLRVGDIILSVNGKKAQRYNLEELSSILSAEEGKGIRLKIYRDGEELNYSFILERLL